MHIYDFPELKPGVFVCNAGWLSEGIIIHKKIANIGVIKQILIHPWIGMWEMCIIHFKKKSDIPIYQLDSREITPGSLVIYDNRDPRSVEAFEKEFNCKLGPLGEIIEK